MEMLGVIRMGTTGHRGPSNAKAGIADALEADLRGVVPDDGVVAEKLEEFATTFGHGLELRFVGELFEKVFLLIGRAIHEFVPEFGTTARVDPRESGEKAILRFVAGCDGIRRRANFAARADGHSVGNHEIDELGDASIFSARRVA